MGSITAAVESRTGRERLYGWGAFAFECAVETVPRSDVMEVERARDLAENPDWDTDSYEIIEFRRKEADRILRNFVMEHLVVPCFDEGIADPVKVADVLGFHGADYADALAQIAAARIEIEFPEIFMCESDQEIDITDPSTWKSGRFALSMVKPDAPDSWAWLISRVAAVKLAKMSIIDL